MSSKTSNDVLSILNKHLEGASAECVVGRWILSLSDEEQQAFKLIKERLEFVSVAGLFTDIASNEAIPFGVTSFKSHFRGRCVCPKTF